MYTFCKACSEVFKRVLVIKMFLRMILAYYIEVNDVSFNGSYTYSAIHVELV